MRNLKTLTLVCMLLLPINIQAEDKALLMGIGDYEHENISDLVGIDKDITMMTEVAKRLGFRNVRVLMNRDVTYLKMKKELRNLSYGVTEQDRVLIYYSGHGSRIKDDNGDELDGADEVLVCQDAKIVNRTVENVLRDDEFGSFLAAIPSNNIYVLIDACNSGTSTRGLNSSKGLDFGGNLNESTLKFWKYPGMPDSKGSFRVEPASGTQFKARHALLSAAQDDEYALTSSSGGYFTRGIYEAVKGLGSHNSLTMSDLKNKTTVYIRNQLRHTPNRVHRPNLFGEPALWNQNMRERFTNQVETLWEILESRVDKISHQIAIRLNQRVYKVGDLLKITCTVNMDGYINVLNVDRTDREATVLYPNQYHRDNRVQKGRTITIPGPDDGFKLPALKSGESLIVVFVSSDSLNAYEMDGRINGHFGLISKGSATRGFGVEAAPSSQWSAGKIITRIEK